MYRVHIRLTTGEKLTPFNAQEFDIDLDKRDEAGLQKCTYLGPDGEEESIYLNPKAVASIQLRPTKESAKRESGEPAADEQTRSSYSHSSQMYRKKLLPDGEDQEDSPPSGSGSQGRWQPPKSSDAENGENLD